MFWQAVLEVLLSLSPWLLLGALVAGVLHVTLPPGLVRRQLRGPLGVVKAVAVGVPLPLCSCGVIPAGLGLRKDGASAGATVGFLVSTPQTGVDSVLVSASFLGWPFALFKVASAAVTGLVAGWITDGVAAPSSTSAASPAGGPDELRRARGLGALLRHSLEILETIWGWLVFGILASATITTFVPADAFAGLARAGGLWAMLVTLAVATPLYVCATASVPIAAALVGAGFPPGAALVFLMAGPATNLATIGAVYRTLGARPLAAYLGTIVVGSVALGTLFDGVIAPMSGPPHLHATVTWWSVAASVIVVGLIAWFAFHDLSHRLRAARARPVTADSLEIDVAGMTCDSCATRLERRLAAAEGIASATVQLEPGLAVVHGTIDEARLRELVIAAGFEPRGVRGPSPR